MYPCTTDIVYHHKYCHAVRAATHIHGAINYTHTQCTSDTLNCFFVVQLTQCWLSNTFSLGALQLAGSSFSSYPPFNTTCFHVFVPFFWWLFNLQTLLVVPWIVPI
eukprot:34577_1